MSNSRPKWRAFDNHDTKTLHSGYRGRSSRGDGLQASSTSVSGLALGQLRRTVPTNVADLGIGFVQSIGDGLTGADMPNNFGSADYSGNWVANCAGMAEEDGNGDITAGIAEPRSWRRTSYQGRDHRDPDGLATLEGAIDTGIRSPGPSQRLWLTRIARTVWMWTGKFTGHVQRRVLWKAEAAEAGWYLRLHVERCGRTVRSVELLVVTGKALQVLTT